MNRSFDNIVIIIFYIVFLIFVYFIFRLIIYSFDDANITNDNSNMEISNMDKSSVKSDTINFKLDKRVIYIKSSINDAEFDFMIDSGCGIELVIPSSAYKQLLSKQRISEKDLISNQCVASIANGKELEYNKFNIKEFKVGDIVLKNVSCAVVDECNVFLIGNPLLSRFASVVFDYENKYAIFNTK